MSRVATILVGIAGSLLDDYSAQFAQDAVAQLAELGPREQGWTAAFKSR
jgi:hypothetical protein